MKRILKITCLLLVLTIAGRNDAIAQSYGLNECIAKAVSNSSSTKLKPSVVAELDQKNQVNALTNLPKIALNGAATYQTAVTSLPIKLPNVNVPTPQKDQYKVTLDLQQNLYDGGLSKANTKVNQAAFQVDIAQIENENYLLVEHVTNLFYTIALAQKQIANTEYLESQLKSKITKAENNFKQGTASKSDVLQLKSSLLELTQVKKELRHNIQGTIDALSIWIGEALTPTFQPIDIEKVTLSTEAPIQRTELKLINAKKESIMANKSSLNAKYAPKISMFATGGYGRPGLNFLSNAFDFYGMGGINLKIPLEHFVLKSITKEKTLLDFQLNKLESQYEQIENKHKSLLALKSQEIQKLEENLLSDLELINFKTALKEIMDTRYNEGIVTTTEYTDAVQAELLAKNNLALHEVQLAFAKTQYNQLKGIN